MKDITIQCVQCGREFAFTSTEQRRYRDRKFSPPRRCPECRKKKAKVGDNSTHDLKNRHSKDQEIFC